jgi:cysteine synthase
VNERFGAARKRIKLVAVEPSGAAILSGGPVGTHQMPGIGVGFVPDVLDRSLIDEVIAVSDQDAFARARLLAREEGILAGVSSGAALHAAMLLAARPELSGKVIVVLLADTGERYLSTALFE